jgi:two-component system nitrogen regulation response regulator NtrX
MCQDENITGDQIRLFLNPVGGAAGGNSGAPSLATFLSSDYKEAKRLFEREYLLQKLLQNDHNISKTADEVGLERSHLHKKLKSLDIIS